MAAALAEDRCGGLSVYLWFDEMYEELMASPELTGMQDILFRVEGGRMKFYSDIGLSGYISGKRMSGI